VTPELQNKLNKYALINRKYQLFDKTQFLSTFSKIETEYLAKAWQYGSDEIQNKEIIKNANELPRKGKKEVSNRLLKFNSDTDDLFYYLNSKFDVKELKLDEEQIERRLRNTLAKRHQKILEAEIKKEERSRKIQEKVTEVKRKVISGVMMAIIPVLIVGFLFGSRIIDGFTPVDVLTNRIYEREVYEFSGSICRDGSTSHSQGRGTCSWHDGVRHKFYEGQHKLTKQECRILAKERSWID